jgi:signal peptidase II
LIDRIWLGAVVDFLDFYIGRYHWPAFNVADSSISVGLALLVILFLKGKGKADRDFLFQESG